MNENQFKKEILIIRNVPRENPGLLLEAIREAGIKYVITDAENLTEISSPESYGAVVVLGGPASANDKTDLIEYEISFIRKVLDSGIPYLGICLGLQLLVKAAGGLVVKSPVKEAGFRAPEGSKFSVNLTGIGRVEKLFEALNDSLTVFQLHGETVVLNDTMELLATGEFCMNQVVRIGTNKYGIQCHFELDDELFDVWVKEDPDLLELNEDILKADYLAIRDEYQFTGRTLCNKFLKIAGYLP